MSQPLRVLIVEDSEDDAFLVIRQLKRGGYETTFERVETAEAMTAALQKQTWDIIIADYRMPHFSAPEALKLLQQSSLDLPFIVVSGTIGEETAVTTMKAGAHDYIMKDNLKRLVPAIERELREAENRRQRKQAEDEVRRSHQYLKQLTDSMWDAVFSVRMPERVIEWANDSFQLIGYKPEECIGKTTAFLYSNKREFSDFGNKLKRAIAGGKDVVHAEQQLRRKNGEVFPAAITTTFFKEKGEIVRVTSIVRDVTERRQIEEALKESEEKLRTILDNTIDVIFQLSPLGIIQYVSSEVKEVYGYEPEDLIGKHLKKTTPVSELPRALKALKSVLSGKVIHNLELNQLNTNGKIIPMEINATPVRKGGKIVAAQGVMRDITERRQAEIQLLRAAEEWRTTFDSIADLVSIHDMDFRIVRVNKAWADLLKARPEELIGKTCYQVIHGTNEPVPGCPHMKTLATKKQAIADFFEPHLGLHLDVSTSPIFNGKGELMASVHVARDVTERKLTEEKAREAEALREVDRLRSTLMANVSHELRTPLASIKGFASTLLQPDVEWTEEEQRDFIQSIDQEADRLTRIISDLLDMSRLEAGALKLEKRNYRIAEILESVSRRLANLTERHQLEIKVSPELPPVFIDEMRIGQVLTNLVENATKFSREGSTITIEAQLSKEQIVVSVADRGLGIPAELMDKVFDRFYQTEGVVTGRRKGTGLGLSICRGIIEVHGGKIWVESRVGQGSKFSFSLPISEKE